MITCGAQVSGNSFNHGYTEDLKLKIGLQIIFLYIKRKKWFIKKMFTKPRKLIQFPIGSDIW